MRRQLRILYRARLFWLLVLLAFAAVFAAGCHSNGSGGDDDNAGDDDDDNDTSPATVDDCGFPIYEIPSGCANCHDMPPKTMRHPENARCYRCHGAVIAADYSFIQPALHQDGEVEYAVGCTSCHGWNLGTSPPQNLKGECGADKRGVGSHAAMRDDPIPAHRVNCSNCHVVPLEVWETGHIDGDGKVEVTFANLATINGARPVWDGTKCTGVYCHGATLQGGTYKEPVWGETGGKASQCGACHRLTDPEGNADANCAACHPTSVDAQRNILEAGTHINGVIDLPAKKKH